jgi:tetratricopeptide (TPR) repeat protein
MAMKKEALKIQTTEVCYSATPNSLEFHSLEPKVGKSKYYIKTPCHSLYSVVNILFLSLFFSLAAFSGCSSAPKKATEIFTDRNTAIKQLDLANYTANRGRYDDALVILEGARKLAVGADDPPLRIKTATSRGNFLFALGRNTEAFADWKSAADEGDASGEPVLAALARIYSIRAQIVLLDTEPGTANAQELKDQLNREMAAVKSDANSTAVGNVTLGLAEKQMGRWMEAEKAVNEALSFHEKGLLLEEAAYDWFLIASIRSLAGNYDTSLEALNMAIRFDRRAENGFGLASSWQAMGDVLSKAGRGGESAAAWRRAAEIYRAIGLNSLAEKLEEKYQ